eukprot:15463356-Alexandrium_andersonii.AAC.1
MISWEGTLLDPPRAAGKAGEAPDSLPWPLRQSFAKLIRLPFVRVAREEPSKQRKQPTVTANRTHRGRAS